MTKRAFIVHGWEGYPKEAWFPWLKRELEKRDFKVKVPDMPNPSYPRINTWVGHLKKIVRYVDDDTYLIGHSIGGQTVLRYIQGLSYNKKVGGALLVASWINLRKAAFETDEDKKIVEPWLTNPLDWERIANGARKFTAILSDNDPYVPIGVGKIFKKELGAEIIIVHNKLHMNGESGVIKLPEALNAILKISDS